MFARISLFIGTAVLMLGFQNCQPAKIAAYDGSSEKVFGPVVTNDADTAEGGIEQTGENEIPTPPELGDEKGEYVCILEGPGKSVKLGIGGGQNPVPDVFCMTKTACLEIASQAFEVKGPEWRGYCKQHGNPHVIHTSNAELQTRIDNFLNP